MTTGQWVLVVAVVLAVGFGLLRAASDGRFRGTHKIRAVSGDEAAPASPAPTSPAPTSPAPTSPAQMASELAEFADRLGERGTMLQFSSAFCAPCRATRRVLEEVTAVVPGVAHVEVDAESHLDLVRRLNILRTPTTVVLDGAGREVTRAAGAPTKAQVMAALALLD